MAKAKADYCIIPDCRQIISYEEGTPYIQCPWCNNRYPTRELKGEQDKILEDLLAGKQAKAALALTVKEKEALQALLNESQKKWISNAEIQKYIKEKLDVLHDDVKDIHADTTVLKADTKQLLDEQTQLSAVLTTKLENVVSRHDLVQLENTINESIQAAIRDAVCQIAEKKSEPIPALHSTELEIHTSASSPQPTSAPSVSQTRITHYASERDFEIEVHGQECTITKYVGDKTEFIIPSIISGRQVVAIDEAAFSSCNFLSKIAIPNSITHFSSFISSHYDGQPVSCINPFAYCYNLQIIEVLPDHPTFALKNGALVDKEGKCLFCFPCSFAATEYAIPPGICWIASWAFAGCRYLRNITIPSSVTVIGDYAFTECSALTNIVLPKSITEIGSNPFANCSNLTDIEIAADHPVFSIIDYALVDKEGKRLISYPCASLTKNYVLSPNIRMIGFNAFDGCHHLTNAVLHDKIETIEDGAFIGCTSLLSIVIPPNTLTTIRSDTFEECSSLTHVELPEGLVKIEFYAFAECRSLTTVRIPASVQDIAEDAFEDCPNLVLHVQRNSYAHQWAREYNIRYKLY